MTDGPRSNEARRAQTEQILRTHQENLALPSPPPGWPILNTTALHGVLGKIVDTIAPETEADPSALLATLLSCCGSSMGLGPRIMTDGAEQTSRLFVLIVGQTSKARKGTSWNRVKQIMAIADPDWSKECITSGMSSGEGIIKAAAQGDDKRLLVVESEFSRVLTVASREGNTLSEIIRQMWDSCDLRVMTKEPIVAQGVHIGIVAHITEEELRARFNGLQAANGFGNRIAFVCARRNKLLPNGGDLSVTTITRIGELLKERLEAARTVEVVTMSSAAASRWNDLYRVLGGETRPGMVGALHGRSEAQVVRIALVYSLLDGCDTITVEHLDAAMAFWSYCSDSIKFLFGEASGDPKIDKLRKIFEDHPTREFDKKELSQLMGGHFWGVELDDALVWLQDAREIHGREVRTRGRPRNAYTKMPS